MDSPKPDSDTNTQVSIQGCHRPSIAGCHWRQLYAASVFFSSCRKRHLFRRDIRRHFSCYTPTVNSSGKSYKQRRARLREDTGGPKLPPVAPVAPVDSNVGRHRTLESPVVESSRIDGLPMDSRKPDFDTNTQASIKGCHWRQPWAASVLLSESRQRHHIQKDFSPRSSIHISTVSSSRNFNNQGLTRLREATGGTRLPPVAPVAFVSVLQSVGMLLLSLLLLLVNSSSPVYADQKLPLELRPYRVLLLVATDLPQQAGAGRSDLLEKIRQVAGRSVGAQWELTVQEVDWLQPVSRDGLKRLISAELYQRTGIDQDKFDVWLVASIATNGAGFRIDVRGWQPAIEVDAGTFGRDIYDWHDIPVTTIQLSHASFRPIGRVDDVDGKQVRILMQGSALAIPDPAFAVASESQVFTPLLASRNREGKIDRLQPIPWTYVTAEAVDETRLKCELQSGLRSAIGGKQRGRVETLAITARANLPATQVELVTQSKPQIPLTGHRIELRDSSEIPKPDGPVEETEKHLIRTLLTDRRGRFAVSANGGKVVWLFAYSGKHLLARVPILPGMVSDLRLEVPDDSSRLETESELYMLQGQLVEAVAARNTAAAKIRSAIKKGDKPLAKAAEAELKRLPDAQVFLTQLLSIRVPAVKAAQSKRDRAGEARINRMCDEMANLIQQYLSEDKRRVVLEELKELYELEPEK